MVKTLAQLRREIASHKMKIAKETKYTQVISERQKLNRELLELKHRKLIGAGVKAKRLSKRFGKAILNVGKKAAPIIQKQARLIREQQLRDDAIADARLKKSKRKIKRKKFSKENNEYGMFPDLNF